MSTYEKAIETVEEYLSQLAEADTTDHLCKGQYRVVFNNWDGCCESTIVVSVNPADCTLTYRMYYNSAKVITETQRNTLIDYFALEERKITYDGGSVGGIEADGAVFVKVEHNCILYGLTCEQLRKMQYICTRRIYNDRIAIKRYLRG